MMVLLVAADECVFQSLINNWPFTQRRTPSSATVAWPTAGSGPLTLQLKLTTASVRVRVGGALNATLVKTAPAVFDQYWAVNPVPLPKAAVLMKEAEATPLLAAPDLIAMACRLTVVVTTKGPV